MRGFIGNFSFRRPAKPLMFKTPGSAEFTPDFTWTSRDHLCWLGQTQSSESDCSGAISQPISSHCGRFTIVFIGNIYNHQLVRKGLRFQGWLGLSDRETLVEGIAQKGPAILLELRGAFAFAAYDNLKQQLLVARDRLGIQPLYLKWQKSGVIIASERSSLPGALHLSTQTVTQVLAFGHDSTPINFPGPETESAVSLPAGMLVRINARRDHDPVRYWPPQPRPDWSPLPIRDSSRARSFLRQQLNEVVAQYLPVSGPVACDITTGLDGCIVAALACQQKPRQIDTYSVSFSSNGPDEMLYPRQLARHCGCSHHELMIQKDDFTGWIQQALVNLDVPTAYGIDVYLRGKALASQGIQVSLCGLGASQLFGDSLPSLRRLIPFLQLLQPFPERIRMSLLKSLKHRFSCQFFKLPSWDRLNLAMASRRWCCDHDLRNARAETLNWPALPSQRITQSWGQVSWAELFGNTEPMLLRLHHLVSVACDLELRSPFLDHHIVEIAVRMPQRFHQPGQQLLREACIDLLPSGFLNQPKTTFHVPMASSMRGPLRSLCVSRLQALKQSHWLDSTWINDQWSAFDSGQLHWTRAWSLVVLGEFAHRGFD